MFANRHGASAEWTRALPAIALSAAIAALSGLPTVTCILSAAEPDGGMVSGRKLSGGAEPKQTTLPPKSSVRGQSESESPLSAAVSTVTESTSKAYRTVASGTSKAYNTVASGTSRAFRSTKETLLPWTASNAKPAKKTSQRREPPPEKGEVIVKHWYEFWKAEPEVAPKPKTVQDFLSQPRLE